MNQKRTIIWSIIYGFVINSVVTWLTFGKIICPNESVVKFISGNTYCYGGGFPISSHFASLLNLGFLGIINWLFWSFIIWLIWAVSDKFSSSKKIDLIQ